MSTQDLTTLTENKKNAEALVTAANRGTLKLLVHSREIAQLKELAAKGHVTVGGSAVIPPKALLQTLVELLRFNSLTLMSLFRPGGSRHTKGKAIDISEYGGFKIDMRSPSAAAAESAINCVSKILENLPIGKYYLGLPRPRGGSARDPANDVFLPVGPETPLRISPKRNYVEDIKLVKEKARQAIQGALARNPKPRILCLYPDSADHLHLDILT